MRNNKKALKKIIIDTDPGHDDALALLLIFLSNLFDIKAVTTVAGNASIDKVSRNAQAILDLIKAKVPIYSGETKPIKRDLITAVVHGDSGLSGFDTSCTNFQLTGNAPNKIVEIVNANIDEITILALGPLSNLARAFQIDTNLPNKIKSLVIMGGAIDVAGNKNRVAEFNFFVDPEAAEQVLKTKVKKILIPLDACEKILLKIADFQKIKNKKLREILLPMMEHFLQGLKNDENARGILVYDVLAAYYLLNPTAFKTQAMDLVVETQGKYTRGMSVAEKRAGTKKNNNIKVACDINRENFVKDFFDILNKQK